MIRTKDLVEYVRKNTDYEELYPIANAHNVEYREEIVARLEELDELRRQMRVVKDCLQDRGKKQR